MDLSTVLPILQGLLPILKPKIPYVIDEISKFLPTYLEGVAKEYNVEKVIIIMENHTSLDNNTTVTVIKYMSLSNGKLETLKKPDGTPHIELASKLVSNLVNIGLEKINNVNVDQK